MSEVRTKHRAAMGLLDEANVARMQGDSSRFLVLRHQAFVAERAAADLLIDAYGQEPTRSILFRSAAVLALDCGEYREAERLASAGLAGSPPEAVAEELRAVQARVHVHGAPVASPTSGPM